MTEIIDFHKNKSRRRKLREERKIGSDFRNSALFFYTVFLSFLYSIIFKCAQAVHIGKMKYRDATIAQEI